MFGKLDKFHILLIVIVAISLAFNVSSFITFNAMEEEIKECDTPEDALSEDAPEDPNQATTSTVEESQIILAVQKGDTLVKMFSDAGISPKNAHLISAAVSAVYDSSSLKVGNKIEINFLEDKDKSEDYFSDIKSIKIITDEQIINVSQDGQSFKAEAVTIPLTRKEKFYIGDISDSLYLSAVSAGISPHAIMEFIRLFSYNVDFQRDIQPGDKFEIFYDYFESEDGKRIKDGNTIYAALISGKTKKEIFRYKRDNIQDYFDGSGQSIKKTLLKTPISGAKISSGFGPRKHPVLGFSRMHKGLDYAAPLGTPILAAGDGIVEEVVFGSNGYGRYVKIKHSSKFSTLYAHMHRFQKNLKKGKRVSQGDVIGFVGSSGMSSGPHLHYEVIEHGKQVNPSKITFPKFPPLEGQELKAFKEYKADISKRISNLESNA